MKLTKKIASIIIALLVLLSAFSVIPHAASDAFDSSAYSTIVTGSDFQAKGTEAADRFGNILTIMKRDGMPVPDSVLVGGDFTKILFDYATPGICLIRDRLTDVYPDAKQNSVVCIQGNHDNPVAGFAATGLYDMGTYSLFCMNEDDFPWRQDLRTDSKVKKTAEKLEESLSSLIEKGETRPVIIITHVPLHHTTRNNCADNRYASYIFDVINKAAEKLDIVFLFGHNHSGTFDDYIGGSVNFLNVGDSIRIPLPDSSCETCYSVETLNFIYTNCGYVGYSDNTESDTSTNKLTVGAIQLSEESIRFVRYSEEGLFSVATVERKNAGTLDSGESFENPVVRNQSVWKFESGIIEWFLSIFNKI